MDTNIRHQQDLSRFGIAVVVLHAKSKNLKDLRTLMPQVNDLLADLTPGQLVEVYPPEP